MTAPARTLPGAAEIAEAMDLDAAFYRAVAKDVAVNPDLYGDRAGEYAAGLAARYEVLAAFCEHEAKRMRGLV